MTNCKDILVPKDDRKWPYFIVTSVTLFFGGLFVILFGRLLAKLCESKASKTSRVTPPNSAKSRKSASKNGRTANSNNEEDDGGFYVSIKEGAGSLINVKTLKGRVMVSPVQIMFILCCKLLCIVSRLMKPELNECTSRHELLLYRCLNFKLLN